MKKRLNVFVPLAFAFILGLVALFPGIAFAQNPNLDMSRPIVGVPTSMTDGIRSTSAPTPEGAGFAVQSTFIAASKFAVRLSSSAPMLTFSTFHYYNSPGSSSPTAYFAQVDLEPGAALSGATCFYEDSSATNDFSFLVAKHTTDFSTIPPTRSGAVLASGSSTGTPGVAYTAISVSPAEIIKPVNLPILNLYYLRADVAGDTTFAGCLVSWNRTISPAPVTATFTDVGTGHPYFQFIEAFRQAGITSGCQVSPPKYCPDQFVTRGQMAVFLARALGLFWPN